MECRVLMAPFVICMMSLFPHTIKENLGFHTDCIECFDYISVSLIKQTGNVSGFFFPI